MINLGYPWWLLALALTVSALLLYYVLSGRTSRLAVAVLAVVLAPLVTLVTVALALTLSAAISPLWEEPAEPAGPRVQPEPATTGEPSEPTAVPDATNPPTPGPTASPSASPAASPSASPSASPRSSASPAP